MKSGVKLKRKSNGLGECGDHVLDDCLKKIVDEKSSFGNGWRFFILQKVREAGCDGKTSDGAV